MARLPKAFSDEQWEMIKDSINKKNIARSSHNKRTHCGSSGGVRLPSDFMTKKELQSMNSDVTCYRINDPMSWNEFKKLPDDLKILYLKFIREKFKAPDSIIAKAFGITEQYFGRWVKANGLFIGKAQRGAVKTWIKSEDSKLFNKWWYGENEPDEHETEKVVDISTEYCESDVDNKSNDLNDLNDDTQKVCYGEADKRDDTCGYFTVPRQGSLSFTCEAYKALDMVKQILGSTNVSIDISWTVN